MNPTLAETHAASREGYALSVTTPLSTTMPPLIKPAVLAPEL